MNLSSANEHVLVSMYRNGSTPSPAVLRVDLAEGTCEGIPLALPDGTDRCTGMTVHGDVVLVVTARSDDTTCLLALDRSTLEQRWCAELSGVRDGHSVVGLDDSAVLVCSSGTDQLVRVDLGLTGVDGISDFWAASKTVSDVHHVNSVDNDAGRILVTGFGATNTGSWKQAEDGFVHDVTADRRLDVPLLQPHTVRMDGKGGYYFCESRREAVHHSSGASVRLTGYTRGVAVTPTSLLVGTSAGRTPSAESKGPSTNCALWILHRLDFAVQRRIPLSKFGSELFDVLVVAPA